MKKTAINPTREENFSEWYQQVIKAADLAENSSVRGCMIMKPHGYALWENMKDVLDKEFKRTGHQNVYFPLLIPLSYLEKEAEHVDGFAKECAVVTHRRLVQDGDSLKPDGELQEPYVIRPTSEMVVGDSFSKWINSYRDLPIKINQWANVMRWEMRPRIFLRTSEFLWQEGHTAHATSEEAMDETLMMLEVYRKFVEETLAIPLVVGEKTESEKFPGAVKTFTIEAMMQDGKALQAGTSHFLGQNFAKAQNIKFQSNEEKEEHAWTTSWGVSTRMIGGLIMTHSDDDGLIIPPKISSTHVLIQPMFRKDEDKVIVMEYIENLKAELEAQMYEGSAVKVSVDTREFKGGGQLWDNIKKGYPVILQIGPRDVKEGKVCLVKRAYGSGKEFITKEEFSHSVVEVLTDSQEVLFNRAKDKLTNNILAIESREEFEKEFNKNSKDNKMAMAFIADNENSRKILSDLSMSFRCLPLNESVNDDAVCILTGESVTKRVLIAKNY